MAALFIAICESRAGADLGGFFSGGHGFGDDVIIGVYVMDVETKAPKECGI